MKRPPVRRVVWMTPFAGVGTGIVVAVVVLSALGGAAVVKDHLTGKSGGSGGSAKPTGEAAALFTPTGVTAVSSLASNTYVCEAVVPTTSGTTVTGCAGGATVKVHNGSFATLTVADVLAAYGPTASPLSCAKSTACTDSELASVTVLPKDATGGADVLDATGAKAAAAVSCSAHSGSSSVDTVSIFGTPIPVSGSPNQAVVIPGVGTITVNYQTYNSSTNTETAAAVRADFNAPGIVSGTLYVSLAQSDFEGCPYKG